MCGIAGYSLSPDAPRRADARGAGAARGDRRARRRRRRLRLPRRRRQPSTCTKLRGGASALLDEIAVPADATQALIHVRDYTKGHPDDRGEQPPDPPRRGRRHPQRRHRERRRDLRPLRHRARRAGDDGRLGGDLRAHGAPATRPARARGAPRRDGRGLARRARRRAPLSSRAASPARSGSARRAAASSSPRRGVRSRSSRQRCRCGSRRARCARDASSRSSTARVVARASASGPTELSRGDVLPPVRAPARGGFCLQRLAAIAAARRSSALSAAERPVRTRPRRLPRAGARARGTGTPSRRRGGRRAGGTPATPRGARSRRDVPPPSRPSSAAVRVSAPARPPASIARSRRSSPCRHLEPGLAERVRQRSERVRVERRRRQRPPRAPRGRARSASGRAPPQAAQLLEELVARQEAAREEAGRPLRRVPRPEVLDDRLRMNACVRVLRELAHRRRAAEPRGRLPELVEDLVVE